ncbi:MAG: DNRLRE domain-containing protein, partial [Clostridia bacterium]|nr:DNRLRE domain-containing protein [Clostridia bacterium]
MKKNAFKLLSVFLSVLMIVMSVPLTAFAADVTDNAIESVEVNTDIIELTDKRTATSKTFRLDDGSYYVAEYDTEIHYLDENGMWQDIDNTLAASGSEFSTSNAKIKFAKKITGNETIFTLHDGNRKLTLSLDGAVKKTQGVITNASSDLGGDATELQKMTTLEKISASILYADILPSTDLEYIVKGLTVKENIIVKAKADDYSYSFTMKLNNLTATQAESGEITITDPSTGETVYYILAPIMWDADHVTSDRVTMTLMASGNNTYTLTVTADAEWMNDPERAYPVTIDPPIYTSTLSSVVDTSVSADMPTTPLSDEATLVLGTNWNIYWKLTSLPSLPDSAYITDAEFTLHGLATNGANGYVAAYDVLTSWDETLTWNTRTSASAGTKATSFADYQYLSATADAQYYTWNVTPLVKEWYAGDNYGLMLAPADGTTFTGIAEFYANDYSATASRPSLCIRYQDMKGIEDYWSYVSQSVGFAGAGSVNLATGNLVFTIPTLTSMDALMPVSPALVYDSSLAGLAAVYPNVETPLSTAIAANGFKLNLSETLLFKTYGDSDDYLVFSDGDGTEHYFMPTSGGVSEILFVDESGLHHTLAFDMVAGTCTVTDSDHTVKVYKRTSTQPLDAEFGFYLSSITDKSGNKVTFTVDSNYRVTAVTLTPYGSSAIEQLKLAYNEEGFPYAVWNPTSGEGVVFRYTNSNLTSVTR